MATTLSRPSSDSSYTRSEELLTEGAFTVCGFQPSCQLLHAPEISLLHSEFVCSLRSLSKQFTAYDKRESLLMSLEFFFQSLSFPAL